MKPPILENITLKTINMSVTTNAKTCEHDQKNSCPQCSKVKMVAYLRDDTRIVWYSFFRDEKKFKNSDTVSIQIGIRLEKLYGERVKKMLFFNNTNGELISEN